MMIFDPKCIVFREDSDFEVGFARGAEFRPKMADFGVEEKSYFFTFLVATKISS